MALAVTFRKANRAVLRARCMPVFLCLGSRYWFSLHEIVLEMSLSYDTGGGSLWKIQISVQIL